jgi:hypothetical protein
VEPVFPLVPLPDPLVLSHATPLYVQVILPYEYVTPAEGDDGKSIGIVYNIYVKVEPK